MNQQHRIQNHKNGNQDAHKPSKQSQEFTLAPEHDTKEELLLDEKKAATAI